MQQSTTTTTTPYLPTYEEALLALQQAANETHADDSCRRRHGVCAGCRVPIEDHRSVCGNTQCAARQATSADKHESAVESICDYRQRHRSWWSASWEWRCWWWRWRLVAAWWRRRWRNCWPEVESYMDITNQDSSFRFQLWTINVTKDKSSKQWFDHVNATFHNWIAIHIWDLILVPLICILCSLLWPLWLHCIFCVCLCSVAWLFLLGCQYQCKWLTGKTRLRNDL